MTGTIDPDTDFRIEIMIITHPNSFRRFCLAGCGLVLATAALPVAASDYALEQERLAAAIRQLNILDELANATDEAVVPSRYHFDYARLREDLQRMRNGIEDYLTPKRAQPRDLSRVVETYRLDGPVESTP